MQTPKGRAGSLEVPQRTSPVTPRTARQLKTTGLDSDSPSSQQASRTPKDRSPKVLERKSPRSPACERKRPSRISELESQIAQLQEDLKKAKDQLGSSESSKRQAQQEAEEAKKQLVALAAKHEESQRQLLELTSSEENRLQELRKISQERDKAWESELDAVQKQHSAESAALSSALNEIQRLKGQLETVVNSEAIQSKDVENLELDFAEAQSVIENLRIELSTCKESEAQAQAMVGDTLRQLETARITVETLRSDGIKTMEAYNSLSAELEQSRARVNMLEELVRKLQMDMATASQNHSGDTAVDRQSPEIEQTRESEQLSLELNSMKLEVGDLQSALEAAEIKYQEEQVHSTMRIHSAYELVEQVKSQAELRETELESELKRTKAHIEELKANLMDKETELQSISEENEGLNMKIEKTLLTTEQPEMDMDVNKYKADIADLKANMMDKETALQMISEENEMLKSEIKKTLLTTKQPELDMEVNKYKADIADLKSNMMDKETALQMISEENEMLRSEIKKRETDSTIRDEAFAETEGAKAAERETLMKLGYMTEEAEKNSKRADRATEQLEAAQAANSEMEAELRRLKVQSDQWRKAAEAAAAVLSAGNNPKCVERSGSMDNNYHPISGKVCSPYSDEMDDDSPKKKNMLKKLGSIWKKGQK